ncbi:hypothetical protein O3G_MSEX008510 [Manduca sexta]|uniref:Peptidase aspartic putative domain-containing protein n=1 Tax=Manduca sexta TaxID=7130 RepID=A0A922CPY7_MANSE|nr:hypothetical protein O3G_MSEX008510 [Manduca sexta]
MFHTPKTMVKTRRTAKRDEEQQEVKSAIPKTPTLPRSTEISKKFPCRNTDGGSVVKSEPPLSLLQPIPSTCRQVPTTKSKRSTSSSVLARKKRLELEAAEAKAKIELELINKRLAADLADIDDECSVQSNCTNNQVEEWLEHSHRELEAQPVPDRGQIADVTRAPTTNVGTDGTIQLLASALKDLAAASTSNGLNSNLLSRICTPKDLPLFSGDSMEWLHFKKAYEESSKVCNFTDNENLWRLRKCLKGSAREAVSALLISATSPDIIMSTLELQFGNPDIILSRIMVDIKKLHPVSQEYHKDIVPFSIKVRNYVAAAKVIGRDEYLNGLSITTCILSKLPPVLLSKWADYSYTFIKQNIRPTWFDISEFLNEEAMKVSSMALLNTKNTNDNYYYNKKKYTEGTHTVLLNKNYNDSEKCRYCHLSKHKLHDCRKFRKALRKDRWSYVKRNRLCYKCIDAHHDRATCPAAVCDVTSCGQAHHKLLHYDLRQIVNSEPCIGDNTAPEPPSATSETVTHVNKKYNECKVLLKVVPISVHGPNGVFKTSALLDDGSTVSLISAALASRAGLCGRRETLRVCGAWNKSALECDVDVMDVCITSYKGERFNITVSSFKDLNVPVQNFSLVNLDNYPHLCNIEKEFCCTNIEPEILIGQDNYNLILPLELRVGKCNEPCATRTPLGWCVHGLVPAPLSTSACYSILNDMEVPSGSANTSLEDLHELVRKSFTIESMGISGTPRQNLDDLRALEHLEQTAKLIDGRWHVGLPWKDTRCKMPDSERLALSRLHNLEKKMSYNKQYAQRYRERIKHLLDGKFTYLISVSIIRTKRNYVSSLTRQLK